jgi:hypothetical protein
VLCNNANNITAFKSPAKRHQHHGVQITSTAPPTSLRLNHQQSATNITAFKSPAKRHQHYGV